MYTQITKFSEGKLSPSKKPAMLYCIYIILSIYSMYYFTGETDQGPQEGYPVKVWYLSETDVYTHTHIHIILVNWPNCVPYGGKICWVKSLVNRLQFTKLKPSKVLWLIYLFAILFLPNIWKEWICHRQTIPLCAIVQDLFCFTCIHIHMCVCMYTACVYS